MQRPVYEFWNRTQTIIPSSILKIKIILFDRQWLKMYLKTILRLKFRKIEWYAQRWFSGRILACHAGGPGSIPGRCNFWHCNSVVIIQNSILKVAQSSRYQSRNSAVLYFWVTFFAWTRTNWLTYAFKNVTFSHLDNFT